MTHDEVLTSGDSTGESRHGSSIWGRGLAVVSAAAVVAGLVGYGIGQASTQEPSAAPAPTAPGMNVSEPGPLGAPEEARDALPYGYGHIVFTASGLSDEPGRSTAWAYDPAAVFSKESAMRAAEALGIAGEPRLVDGMWLVGARDGSVETLQLVPDGVASLTYQDPTLDPYGCVYSSDDSTGGGTTSSTGAAEPDTKDEPRTVVTPDQGGDPDSGAAPALPIPPPAGACMPPSNESKASTSAATGLLQDVLDEMGVDTAGYDFETADYGVANAVGVTAFETVEGERTGAAWTATLVDGKVQSLYGGLAPLVSLGNYDVISPVAAVDRLADPRFASPSYGSPLPYATANGVAPAEDLAVDEQVVSPDFVVAPTPKLAATLEPGDSFGWPVDEVTITKADLMWAPYAQPNGAMALLPTYELASSDGQSWQMIAVDEASLDFDS